MGVTKFRKFQVLLPDGTVQHSGVEMSAPPTLQQLRNAVEPILRAPMMHLAVELGSMFVDDIAFTKGLPRNEQATAVYRAATLHAMPGILAETLPFISGPAVLFRD